MNTKLTKFAQASIPFFLILVPLVFSSLFDVFFENAGPISIVAGLAIFLLFAFLFKRSFCAFLCLVGALQRLVGLIGFKVLKRRVKVPAKLDRYLRAVKYSVLIGIIVLSIVRGTFLLLVSVDDVFEQFNLLVPAFAWISIVFIFVTIIGSFFIDNFFCSYICIQGSLAGLAGRFSPAGIVRAEDTCINCRLCTKACPSNIEVHALKKVVSTECLSCQKCIIACPKKGTLTNRWAGLRIPLVLFVAIAGMSYLVLRFVIPLFV